MPSSPLSGQEANDGVTTKPIGIATEDTSPVNSGGGKTEAVGPSPEGTGESVIPTGDIRSSNSGDRETAITPNITSEEGEGNGDSDNDGTSSGRRSTTPVDQPSSSDDNDSRSVSASRPPES
ncbi:hypothetical protein EV182_004866, partial [Spiromyces aspiralis]